MREGAQMSDEAQPEYVTMEGCRDRRATTKWTLGVLLGLVAVFLTGVVYAISNANNAARETDDVSTRLESHVATQKEMERHLVERLDEIRADVRENRTLLHEILRNGKQNQ
jgi:uncharacterized membrane protein